MNYWIPGLYNHTGLKILVLKPGVKKFGIKMCSNSYGLYFQSQVIKKSGVKEGIQEGEKKIWMPLVMWWEKSAPPLVPNNGGAISFPDNPVTCVQSLCNRIPWLKSLRGWKFLGWKVPGWSLGSFVEMSFNLLRDSKFPHSFVNFFSRHDWTCSNLMKLVWSLLQTSHHHHVEHCSQTARWSRIGK